MPSETWLTGIQAVFFDAVGTVLHPDPGALTVYASTAARFGLAHEPADILTRFRDAYRREEAVDRAVGWITSEDRERERWRTIVATALPGSSDECFEFLYHHFGQPAAWRVPHDAAAVFDALTTRGLRLGLGSNYDSRLETVLAGRRELDPLRERVVISSRVGVRKPDRGFFRAVIAAAGCEPEHILFVGDDIENDYAGATAAGFRAVLLDPHDRYPDVPARIASLRELIPG